ncbi:MAG: FtsX-like permease family protein [Rhizobiales bacterium]|nr:FtsX-like permease family protein [Hyphomicrobiales bacterium]
MSAADLTTPAPAADAPAGSGLPLALRFALRDLRGGLRGFGIFLACIALGVAAIVGVGSVSRGLTDGLARQGRMILGGDIAFSIMHRELAQPERAFLEARGRVAVVATQRGMARTADGRSALIEIKAVDAAWPSAGAAAFDPPMSVDQALRQGARPRVAAEPALLARLDLKPGDVVSIGDLEVEIAARLVSEPDKLAAGVGFGPRVLMSVDTLKATGLVQPGSLTRWHYRVSLPTRGQEATDAAVEALAAEARAAFPEIGWEVRSRANVSPQFERNIARFTQFLTLVGLTALVVGGVGVANAVAGFVDRKRASLATLKSLGATGSAVFGMALTEVMLIAAIGVAIGLSVGAALPFLVVWLFGALIPVPLEAAVYPRELALGALYGALTALAFALPALGRVHDVPVSALFRDRVDGDRRWPRPRYLALAALAGAALIGAAVLFASEKRIAVAYAVAVVGAFGLLRLVAVGVMALARRAPRPRSTELRLALANIHRPGALTPSVTLSLGLGLALLVALALIESNISGQLRQGVAARTPSFFFLDVRSSEAERFAHYLGQQAPDAALERTPMMRGRIVRVNGVPSEQVAAKEEAAWALEGDRGVTYAATLPSGSTIAGGEWWAPDHRGEPLVSLEKGIAEGIGVKVGDTLTVNVLGRNVTARIANLRRVDWRSFGINFVLVFSPNTFAGAPHTELATIAFAKDKAVDEARDAALLRNIGREFPTVTSVRVKDALDAANEIVAQLALAVRGAASIAVVASILVLAGALAAGQRARVYDAVVLKTLGATRGRLIAAYLAEYAMIGAATAAFGILAGSLAAWGVGTQIMRLDFVFDARAAGAAALGALALTVVLGLVGTWRTLGESPARRLRSL